MSPAPPAFARHDLGRPSAVQRRFVLDDGTAVTAPDQLPGITLDNLDAQILSPDTWMVHEDSDLEWLDVDAEVEVLTPRRHVIGEVHNDSHFNDMRAKWPQAAAMGEGVHRVEEAGLQLPASPAHGSHDIFNDIAHQVGGIVQPLENFHTANMMRLAIFLTQWNEQRAVHPAPFDWIGNPNRRRLIPEAASIANQYVSLAVGVYLRGLENSVLGIWPSYDSAVEKEYGRLYNLARGTRALRALNLLDGFRNNVNGGISPTPTQNEYDDVKWYVRQLLTPIERILVISTALGSNDQVVIQFAKAFGVYLRENADTLRDAQVNEVLAMGNPPRERVMARQIASLAKPGLVKVGTAHVPALRGHGLPDTDLYDDWQAFDTSTQKTRDQL